MVLWPKLPWYALQVPWMNTGETSQTTTGNYCLVRTGCEPLEAVWRIYPLVASSDVIYSRSRCRRLANSTRTNNRFTTSGPGPLILFRSREEKTLKTKQAQPSVSSTRFGSPHLATSILCIRGPSSTGSFVICPTCCIFFCCLRCTVDFELWLR